MEILLLVSYGMTEYALTQTLPVLILAHCLRMLSSSLLIASLVSSVSAAGIIVLSFLSVSSSDAMPSTAFMHRG